MKALLFFVFLYGLFSCASMTSTPASDEEKKQYMMQVLECLDQIIPEIDDGYSDASTIARAAKNHCSRQFRNNRIVLSQGLSSARSQNIFVDNNPEMDRAEQNTALTSVLLWRNNPSEFKDRAKKRAPTQQPIIDNHNIEIKRDKEGGVCINVTC